MVGAIAAVGHEVAIVLQHVQMVIGDQALDFMLRPLPGFRHSQIYGLPLERLRLPVGGQVGHHPVANFGIARIQGARLGRQPGLRPIYP